MAGAGVIRAEDDEALRQFRQRVKRGRDMTAVHESRVRHDRTEKSFLCLGPRIRGEARVHLRAQTLGRALVERARDGGRADGHGCAFSRLSARLR